MTVRLRPHHLLCMLTYVGKGYSSDFVRNYDRVIERVGAGEDIVIVAGPDDVCAPLLDSEDAHCRRESVTERDRQAALAAGALLKLDVKTGTRLRLTGETTARMRVAFRNGGLRGACAGCEWSDLCTDVASGGYRGVRLLPS